MPIIIDGHNLLWSIGEMSKDSEPISDVQLCRIVSRYLKLVGENGEMVFDGTGPPQKTSFDNLNNLEVIFCGFGTEADTIIEDKIRANSAPKRLTVVSSDRRLRDAARSRRAVSMKSEMFWGNIRKELRRKKRANEPAAKQKGISEGETKQWLEFFGLEQ